jgi:transposase
MERSVDLAQMDAEKLRDLAATLISQLAERDAWLSQRDAAITARDAQLAQREKEIKHKQLKIDQLTHEMATLKRWQYGGRSEQLDAVQRSLLDDSIDADIAAIDLEIEALQERPPAAPKSKPRRVPLPA